MRKRSIKFLLLPVILIVLIGIIGFCFIEGWSLIDAFYMTITTLTTVGFGEVHALSPEGRLFTSGLIIVGVGIATYTFSEIISLIVEGEIFRTRLRKKMEQELNKVKDHIILCGFGRLGQIVHKDLLLQKQKVVVIEQDDLKIQELHEKGILSIKGSAYDDEILQGAGIKKAKILLTLLPNDASNVYVTLCARDLNPNIKILARTEEEGSEARLKRAGANEIIAPYRLSGNKIVQKIIRPYVSDFLEIAGTGQTHSLIIEEVRVPPDSKIVGKTIEESKIRSNTGAIIAAIISNEGSMTFNPTGKDIIEGNSTMIILGQQDALNKFSNVF